MTQEPLTEQNEDEMIILRNKYRLSRNDMVWLDNMKKEKVICPNCLYKGTLFDFKTFKRIGKHKVSTKLGECPDCGKGVRISTLRMVARYSMWEFANYFWENFYVYKNMFRVYIPKVKERLRHFSYENRQVFWDVWRKWSAGDRPFWRKEDLEEQEGIKEKIDEYEKKMKEAFRRKLTDYG